MRPQDTAYIIERLAVRFMAMVADHERQLAEHRASFGARTEADAKIIAGLREELDRVRNSLGIQAAKEANKVLGMVEGEGLRGAAERVVKERDGLLTQVQDMRAEIKRLQWENATMHKDAMTASTAAARISASSIDAMVSVAFEDGYAEAIKVLGDPIALSKERDALRAEVAELKTQLERLTSWAAKNQAARETLQTEIERLKSQTPKHPVKVGEHVAWCGSGFLTGTIKQVAEVRSDRAYRFTDDDVWSFALCEPCDPPATHDTEAGKAAAAAAVKTEPVADEIKVGDVVEVFQSTASCTFKTDIGTRGTVLQLDDSCVDTAPLDGFLAPKCNHVALCDVWKVTT